MSLTQTEKTENANHAVDEHGDTIHPNKDRTVHELKLGASDVAPAELLAHFLRVVDACNSVPEKKALLLLMHALSCSLLFKLESQSHKLYEQLHHDGANQKIRRRQVNRLRLWLEREVSTIPYLSTALLEILEQQLLELYHDLHTTVQPPETLPINSETVMYYREFAKLNPNLQAILQRAVSERQISGSSLQLLLALASEFPNAVSTEKLIAALQSHKPNIISAVELRVHIGNLRKKLDGVPVGIKNSRGFGYALTYD